MKSMAKLFSVMTQFKKCILQVKTVVNSLTYALIKAIAKVDNDSNYKSYRDSWKIVL